MILEGLITTINEDGNVNISPMGPIVDEEMKELVLRPYQTSTTYRNLKRTGQGVLHVTDDVELLARTAVGKLIPLPKLLPARRVQGQILADACRWYEFQVRSIDDRHERTTIIAEVVETGRIRDFFGFNRAKHAVLEAAILATRIKFLPATEILAEFERLAVPVEKTAGPQERRAFEFLAEYVRNLLNGARPRERTAVPKASAPAIRIVSPSRLHFGMFSFGRPEVRQFGGVGAMIDQPPLELWFTPAERLEIIGIGAARARQFVEHAAQHAEWLPEGVPCRIEVVSAPPSHIGLGSGTQLGMAVAQGLNAFFGGPWRTPQEFARAVGRGRRSAIGLYGALAGGLIIEAGKYAADQISPMISRIELPLDWRFVLAWPRAVQGLSGEAETNAFERLPPVAAEATGAMTSEALLELAPGAATGDFERFGESLYRFGRLAGRCFAAEQGGDYANPRIAQLVDWLRQQHFRGVGQSSWGPAAFALTCDLAAAETLTEKLRSNRDFPDLEFAIAAPANRGAMITGRGDSN